MGLKAPEEAQFNGWPVLKIFTGKVYKGEPEYLMVGMVKAAAICEHIDSIRQFVDKHERKG